MKDKYLWSLVLFFRVASSCLCVTYFYADEIPQSLEVAHHMVFKYGFLTGEWDKKLNSSLFGIRAAYHPFIYSVVYYVLKLVHLDNSHLFFFYAPRVLNGILAFVMDYSLYKYVYLRVSFEKSDYAHRLSNISLLFSLFCPANLFLGIRFFSNSLETILTTIGMWMWLKFEENTSLFQKDVLNKKNGLSKLNILKLDWQLICLVWIVLLGFFLRTSNSLIWVGHALLFCVHDGKKWHINSQFALKRLGLCFQLLYAKILSLIFSVCTVVMILFFLDYFTFGEVIFPFWENLKFNIINNGAAGWGVYPVWYYFAFSLPFFLGGFLLPLVWGACTDTEVWREVAVALAYIVPLSGVGHKELRFAYPAVPALICAAARGMTPLLPRGGREEKRTWPFAKRFYMGVCIVVHLAMGWVVTRGVSDRALFDALPDIRTRMYANETGLFFNISEFSIPMQSYFHLRGIEERWQHMHINRATQDVFILHRFYTQVPFSADMWADHVMVYAGDEERFQTVLKRYDCGCRYKTVKRYRDGLSWVRDVPFVGEPYAANVFNRDVVLYSKDVVDSAF